EPRDASRDEREYVTLLRLIAPDLHRRELRFGAWNLAQIDLAAPPAVRDGFGQSIRQAAGADIVDQQNRIGGPLRPAAVNDLLCAALNLRIAPLHRSKIQLGRALAAA